MTLSKITNAPTHNEQINKINEVIDKTLHKQDNITSSTNIDSLEEGIYYISSSPSGLPNGLKYLIQLGSAIQIALDQTTGIIYHRAKVGGSFSNWYSCADYEDIPSVGNGTITITQGGVTKGTFTTNQSGNLTIDLDAGSVSGTLTNIATGANSLIVSGAIESDAQKATAIGKNAEIATGNYGANSVAIGYGANCGDTERSEYGNYSVALGQGASIYGSNNVAIGQGAVVDNNGNSVAIGSGAVTRANNAIQIGKGTNTEDNSLYVSVGMSDSKNYKMLDTNGKIPNARINMDSTPTQSSTNAITSGGVYDALQNVGGASRNIGEIVTSTIPLTDAGLHLLDGSTIYNTGIYSDFFTKIQQLYNSGNYDYLFTTASDWQTSVETYGVCGKFVYSAGLQSLRLPKVTGFTEGTIDVTTLGDLTEAGLPNITGSATGNRMANISNMDGALSITGASSEKNFANGEGSSSKLNGFNFNASRSSTIYGNSDTVQPQSIKVLYYIVIANSTKTEIEVDIDNIATDLNGKADRDLANLSSTSSANFDGQPTFKYVLLLEGKVTVNTSTNLKSTGYLPNDNYRYEVLVSNMLRSSSAIYSSIGNVASPLDNGTSGVICKSRVASSSAYSYNQCWIPLGTDGVIYYQTSGSPGTGITFDVLAYRRIGTNT